MSLPAPWIDRLFAKLTLTYGQSFLRMYDGIGIDDVKANWGHELSGFQQSPDAIRYGLENLPADKAPTVLQFRELCRRGMSNAVAALAGPDSEPASPEVVEKAVIALKGLRENASTRGWAERLKAREQGGEKLTLYQRKCWREALGEAQ